jgi:beta-fructofuranosidase
MCRLGSWAEWLAWRGTWIDFETSEDYPSALTLPRRLVLSPDRTAILTPPIETVIQLRDQTLDGMAMKAGMRVITSSSFIYLGI